ncbi:MAG: hypothetical protein AAF591_20030 [Verrucomicrobiota bacterium]
MGGTDGIRYLLGRVRYHVKFRRAYAREFARLPDRVMFDEAIIPSLASDAEIVEVLDVGCQWYNLHHARHFRGKRYHTIDIEPEQSRYGASRHVVGSFLDARDYYGRGQFDLVLINGVFGWGIDGVEQLEEAMGVLGYLVKGEGVVVVGWNQLGERVPVVPVGELFGEGWEGVDLIGAGSEVLANEDTGHTFSFFRRGGEA